MPTLMRIGSAFLKRGGEAEVYGWAFAMEVPAELSVRVEVNE